MCYNIGSIGIYPKFYGGVLMDSNRFNVIERGDSVFLFDKETEDILRSYMVISESFLSDKELEEVAKQYHLVSVKRNGKIYFFQDWPV